jgi:protein disulfide-isomerase A1
MKLAGFLVAAFCLALAVAEIPKEQEVLVLTKDNFDEALAAHEYILVEFYAPWCGHCKTLAPEYAKAAEKLLEMESEIKLAKVDATAEPSLAELHGVRGYPTLKFFRKSNPIDYNGGRTAEDIVNWVTKKTGPAAKDLTSVEEVKAFLEAHEVGIVGFFKDPTSEKAKIFFEAGNAIDDQVFGIVSDEKIFEEYKAEDEQVILFKKFDEGQAVFDQEFNLEELKKFIAVFSLPLIVDFNQDTAQKIFGGEIKSHLLVFLSKSAGHFDDYVEGIKETAKKFRGKILFVTIDADEKDHKRILEFFGMKEEDVPAMRIIELKDDMAKYKPENPDLNAENVLNFVTAFAENKLKRHLLTQDLPEDWDKNEVKVLVGTNFAEIALDKTKNVLVEFYAPWCGHCKQLEPIYEKLGLKFTHAEDIVIAKMDATANELEEVKVNSFPTIILYKKETNEAVEYSGERTLEGLIKFIESDGTYGQSAEEAQEEDEDDDVPRKDEL